MSAELLPCVEIDPDGPCRASVVWMHGLGADGHDFVPIVPELGLDPALGVRFVFPHAPKMPVSVNMGHVMPAWFDVIALGGKGAIDEPGVREAATWVEALLSREKDRGVPAERIVLAGFSQGGSLALHAGLRHPEPLAGIVALSTFLTLGEELAEEGSEANRATPILQCHGSLDPMVSLDIGVRSRDRLRELGYAVDWHEYPMQHQVCMEEIEVVGRFLGERLG